ncbi:MAG: esterase family protein [Acidobacteria bacterium]|nr:esterase family protein [Acidobacteriota bacterium]
MTSAVVLLAASGLLTAQTVPFDELAARMGQPDFPQALARFGAALEKGEAYAARGGDFLFAVQSGSEPRLCIDDQPCGNMQAAGGYWYQTARLRTGTAHRFHYLVNGARLGGRNDLPAYPPDAYAQPGVPQGKLSEKLIHTSRIYPGMVSDYWIYVPAQYDPGVPAALMVWQDGAGNIQRDGASRVLNVSDNLIHKKKIPVMIQVFISPGRVGERAMRSIEYDTVNDTYARFLRDEVLAEVQARYNIRRDGYSRAIAGNSSGGICAFNVAWHQPGEFSRVLSRIGSFTSIQWKPGDLDGGNVYPFMIRKQPKRNIRVWLQDGSEDLENAHGSWPLQNLQMANSLKYREYDFHLSWGSGTHNGAHGNAELPEALTWLWRDYDASRTSQDFAMEPSEKDKPYFRVRALNRD